MDRGAAHASQFVTHTPEFLDPRTRHLAFEAERFAVNPLVRARLTRDSQHWKRLGLP